MSFYIENYSYMFVIINFGDILAVSITLDMNYFIYRKVIIFTIMDRLSSK